MMHFLRPLRYGSTRLRDFDEQHAKKVVTRSVVQP